MALMLSDILHFDDYRNYKIHAARWNQRDQPLDTFVDSWDRWVGWNNYRTDKNDFNRQNIFSLMAFYPERDIWLFGGIFKVLGDKGIPHSHSYRISLLELHDNLIGRLKIRFPHSARQKSLRMERSIDRMEVAEILKEKYSGEVFCGYEKIDHGFQILEPIFRNQRPDWKTALENVKGVYLITDKNNGKRYVGSAYGGTGVWSRWSCYMGTGHGYNDELTAIIKKNGFGYAREHFKFSLLEYRPMKTDDAAIIERESYWKDVLLTRGEFGYNKN